MTGLIHQAAIERLRMKYGDKLETRKFRKRLEEEMLKTPLYEMYPHDEVDEALDSGRSLDPDEFHTDHCISCALREAVAGRKPDAFMIEQTGEVGKDWEGQITIFEVEDTHPTPESKLRDYINLFWSVLDREYWNPIKFVSVDRWGKENAQDLVYEIEHTLTLAEIEKKR